MKAIYLATLAVFCGMAANTFASVPPPQPIGGGGPRLDTWLLCDTNWLSARGHAPVSFTNLSLGDLGYAGRLRVDSADPAWLQYNVVEADGTTNLTVDVGSVVVWVAPDWSSTNQGGSGPEVFGRLLEAGAYTEDSSAGWFSLYVDDVGANLFFSAQANDGSSNLYSLSTPISWTNNLWHMVALTYCPTGTCIYLDGVLATNGPGLSCWPGPDALASGFFVGSDSATGLFQACGMFGDLATYRQPLSANAIAGNFGMYSIVYNGPLNLANLGSAPYSTTNPPALDPIAGPGFLQLFAAGTNCVSSTNIWLTNVVCTLTTNGGVNMKFTIGGGSDGVPYDVFGTSALWPPGSTNSAWAWMGQGYHCNTYLLTNLPSASAYFLVSDTADQDADGLTDAFERLVSHTDPLTPNTAGDGLSDLYKVFHGMQPHATAAVPSLNSVSIQTCPIP
jgi:hypothetical protein